jgi:hypothetical protein
LAASPFYTRKEAIRLFERAFGLKRATLDRRLCEIREGWRPPFRR